MKPNLKKLLKLSIMGMLLVVANRSFSQTTTPDASDKINNGIDKANKMKGAIDNVKGLKDGLGGIFPGKKPKDTVFVFIANITYTDPNLALLKSNISKSKVGVRSTLKDGIVILKLVGTNDASMIYDNLDKDLQKIFIANSIEDNKLTLNYKTP